MIMNRSDIAEKLKQLIESQNNIRIGDYDENLDIDSFTMMLLITFVDDEIGVQMNLDEIDFDAFKSINTFTDLIMRQVK